MTAYPELTDHEVFDRYPDIMIDHDNIDHYRALAAGRLVIRRCQDCGYWIYPHRPICPECLSWNVRYEEISGRGTVFMDTRLHQLRDPKADLFELVVVAAVELAEQPGLRYLARIIDAPPEGIAPDTPVSLVWIEIDGLAWPAFSPIAG